MILAAGLRGTETVIEIGTGKGILTRELAPRCRRLDGYEVDHNNYEETLHAVKGGNVFIHHGDAFTTRPVFDVIVSSLPYSRSYDFVQWISRMRYDRGVVLLQSDFVAKILSPPGGRDYRAVSVIAQISSEMKVLGFVDKSAFRPQPRVTSTILAMRSRMRLSEDEVANIKRLFSIRRRKVSWVLGQFGFDTRQRDFGTRRISSLTPAEVHEICEVNRSNPSSERVGEG
jgi:16S rRNA A1518/A1519 N6-dimethyltransferase RsmA/KsgA/DIM1 with predicted DNA glycosylase/AP lyase activity